MATSDSRLRNGGFELAGLKAVSPLYIRDREQWEYAKAAAARSVTTSRSDGSSIVAEQGRGNGHGRRVEWLDAASEHLPNGEKALRVRDRLPRDGTAHRLSPESRLPGPADDQNPTTSLD